MSQNGSRPDKLVLIITVEPGAGPDGKDRTSVDGPIDFPLTCKRMLDGAMEAVLAYHEQRMLKPLPSIVVPPGITESSIPGIRKVR